MASKLMRIASHEAENQYECSLRQAFEAVERKLRPPFPLTIPNPQEYSQLNKAILYGVLCEPHFAKTHIKYLHAIVTDGYGLFVSSLVKIVNELYVKLHDSVKDQLIWVTKEMIDALGVGFDGLLFYLLRQIVGGDFSDENLWLCFELARLFLGKWDCLLEEEPLVLSSGMYTFLRLLADHCRLSSSAKLDELKRLEIEFCIKMLREQFHLCLKIGRDLVRLLQDLVHVPEFRAVWKDMLLNPSELKTPGFSDISQLYRLRTSSRYFLLRITPEMETQLRFLLTHVKFGNQRRYQAWFAKKFLFRPERETLVVDIIRFICCGHHPSNEIIQSDIIPRWAVIGWLLKCCRKNYFEASAKLALLYDWLFFEESVDNIMNIEPAILLMVCSMPRYIDMTHTLLDFLFLLVDNYDVDRKDIIVRGVTSAFGVLVRKGVVHSLDVLTSSKALSPFLKERLGRFSIGSKVGATKELQQTHPSEYSVPPLRLPSPTPSSERQPTRSGEDELATKCTAASVLIPQYSVPPLRLPSPTLSSERQPTRSGEDELGTKCNAASVLIPQYSVPPLRLPSPTPSSERQPTRSGEDELGTKCTAASVLIPQYSVPPLRLPSPTPSSERQPTRRGKDELGTKCTDASVLIPQYSIPPLRLPSPTPSSERQPTRSGKDELGIKCTDASVLIPQYSVPPMRLPSPTPSTERQPATTGEDELGTKCTDASVLIPQYSAPPMRLPSPTPSIERQPTRNGENGSGAKCTEASVLIPDDLATASVPISEDFINPYHSSLITSESCMDSIESLVQKLGETIRSSNTMGLETLEDVLLSFVQLESQKPQSDSICPEILSSKVEREFELSGYRLFAPLESLPDTPDRDDETGTPTALIIRTFIISQHDRIEKMLLFWSKNGVQVGARLLSYTSRLAYEADMVKNAMVDNNIVEVNASGMALLIFHVDGYFSFLNGRKRDSRESLVYPSKIDKEFISKLVESAYTAYRCFLMITRTVLHKGVGKSLSNLLFSDLVSCSEWGKKRLKFLFGSLFLRLPDLSISEEDIIKLLVSRLDHADLVNMQLEISLKRYSLFGEKTEIVFQLIKKSLNWDCMEQHKFWGLIRSELAVSNIEVEKIILEFFCSREVDKIADAIAVGGLVALCNSCAPTPELVGTIMLLPDNGYQDFAAAALASWVVSNPSMLFDSLAKFSEKFDNKNGDSIFSNSAGIMINRSAILWLLNHFDASEMSDSNIMGKFHYQ